jgi:hypothetical protein
MYIYIYINAIHAKYLSLPDQSSLGFGTEKHISYVDKLSVKTSYSFGTNPKVCLNETGHILQFPWKQLRKYELKL